MDLRRLVLRSAAAVLVAGSVLECPVGLHGQTGVPLPPINPVPTPTRTLRGIRPDSPAAVPVAELPPPAQLPALLPGAEGTPTLETPRPEPIKPPAEKAPAAKPPAEKAPAEKGASSAAPKADQKKPEPPKFWWEKVPPFLPLSRPAYFPIPPTGPGFYSLEDKLNGEYRENPPKYPYPRFGIIPPSFFDIDWSYLDKPDNTEHDYWDFLKRQRFGDCDQFMFTAGGDFRARYNFEENSRLLNTGPFRGRDNNYDLYRLRLYGDLYWTDQVRLYAEVLSATSPNYLLPPLVIDRDPIDFLNLFIDYNLGDVCCHPLWLRVGRQELLYGSQRLVSTLDWANTRRTFQGAKLFWKSDKVTVDAFCVQPVIPDYGKFDSSDNNQLFAGLWTTYRPSRNQTVDVYYLFLDNTNTVATGSGGVRGGTTVNTFGARCTGDHKNWLYDVECMVQYGGWANQTLFAKAYTMGGGYHFKDHCWSPVVWLYYDHASGESTPGEGNLNRTFNQLFPFGHYYMGFIDVVGRRNINDVNAHLTFYPSKWITTQLQCHNFWLDSPRDALYNAAGAPIRQDRTGRSGTYVGTEFDLLLNFHLSKHSDILISYSYMIAGSFIVNTASTQSGRDNPQALYMQYSYRW